MKFIFIFIIVDTVTQLESIEKKGVSIKIVFVKIINANTGPLKNFPRKDAEHYPYRLKGN